MAFMLCPKCKSKAIIRASEEMGDETRYLYYQCKNLNCSTTFRCSLTVDHVISSPEQGSRPPDPKKQPELLENPNQMDLLGELQEASADAA